jgi:hypothetical protein
LRSPRNVLGAFYFFNGDEAGLEQAVVALNCLADEWLARGPTEIDEPGNRWQRAIAAAARAENGRALLFSDGAGVTLRRGWLAQSAGAELAGRPA